MNRSILNISLAIFLISSVNTLFAQTDYSGTSNIQFLYGRDIDHKRISLSTITIEHVGQSKAFEHFGFADFFYTSENDMFNIYTEWYPKVSLSRVKQRELNLGPLSDVLLGGGINATVLDIDDFFVILGGPVWQFDIPGFNLFQLETYFYQHLGHPISYQITYSWDVQISVSGKLKLRTRGFFDYIGPYGTYETQIITQPQLLLDVGNLWGTTGILFIGMEWRHWDNFQGEEESIESIPQMNVLIEF